MEIKEIPTPTMPDWLKLYNTYDPEYYAPGKRVSAEEWNTLFLASVRQGNYNADTLELLIKTYLPETYLTQVDFNQFSNEMRTAYSTFTNNIQEGFIAHKTQVQEQYDTFTTQVQEDFTALTSEVNSLEERVVKAENVAYSLNDVIQEANEYAQAANQTAIESNTFAQEAKNNASTALETANSAASTAASSNNTAQDALSTAQSAVTTANNTATQATQAVNTANAASLRAEDAIATANAAKAESAAAKNTAAQAETTANASNATATSANNTASEAKRIAQNALDLVTEGQGSQVIVNGVAVDTFNADTKADLDYVDRQIAALIGAAPETLDTLEEVAKAIKENETVVDALNAAIGTKANKADIEPTIQFAESERQKSKNLFNSAMVPIQSDSLEYNVETNTFIYTVPNTIESSSTGFVILKYGNLSAGTYTMSFDITSTIGNTAPVIVAKLDEYDNFSSSIATKNIIDGYVYLTFTLNEETNIGLAWYYKAGWIAGDAPSGVKTLTNLQLEEGSVATDYQPYNGPIVRDKQLTEQLSNYLPLSGGTLTGQLKLASDGLITNANDGYSIDRWGNLNALSSDAGALFKINSYDKSKSLTYAWNTGLLTLPSIPKVNDVNVALLSDLNNYLPLSGGTMTGAILFPDNATYSTTTQPTALSYGRLQAYGTLNINGNTDNSGTEYVNITAGHGCSSSTADGLSIGTDTLTWKDQPVALKSDIAMGDNFTTYTVIDATALDENTWYPVTFDASRKNLKIMLFNQWNGGNPSWATHSTKNYGCVKIWETTGNGWGELGVYRKVYLSVFTYTNTDPVRGIGQLGNSSTEYVYVRGGGKYNFYTSHNVVPVLRTSTYTVASQSIAPTTTAPAEIVQTIMTTDDAQTISGIKTFTSDIILSKAIPLINITNTSTSGDTSIRCTRSDTGNSCYFGIGSGGVNRGFYDLTQNRWVIYCDGSKSILNSATVPSGQTLTIAGTLNLIV